MVRMISKEWDAREKLIAEVEALFELTTELREKVEYQASIATSPGEPEMTYERFYHNCGLALAKMLEQPMEVSNEMLPDGTPDGGWIEAPGLAIRWQRGCLNPEDSPPWNGCFLVTLLQAAEAQLKFYQEKSKFRCDANNDALCKVQEAIAILNKRQVDRFCRGVRGKPED